MNPATPQAATQTDQQFLELTRASITLDTEGALKVAVISPGFAEAKALVVGNSDSTRKVRKTTARRDDRGPEYEKFQAALATVQCSLTEDIKAGGDSLASDLLNTQLALLEDSQFLSLVKSFIEQHGASASFAVKQAVAFNCGILADGTAEQRRLMDDWRALEIALVRTLTGEAHISLHKLPEPCIVVCRNPTIADIQSADRVNVKGWVVGSAAAASHVRLLLCDKSIPVVAMDDLSSFKSGDKVLINTLDQRVDINPSAARIERHRALLSSITAKDTLTPLSERASVTQDGTDIEIHGTLNDPSSLDMVAATSSAIGLFRTEFMFLGKTRAEWPTEDQQTETLVTILKRMSRTGKVTARTVDLGGDKWDPAFGEIPGGSESKLGVKSLRLALSEPAFFRTHLSALIRAQAQVGNLNIMFPMVGDLSEFRQAKKMLNEEAERLLKAGVIKRIPHMKVGAMIETPVAALGAAEILTEADFISVGSSDLQQYFFAADRDVSQVNHSLVPYHPQFLKLLAGIIDAAHAADKGISICGDMPSHRTFLPILLGLGFTRLTIATGSIAKINGKLPDFDVDECRALVQRMMTAKTDEEAAVMLREFHRTAALQD